ncbi:MAG: DUF4369 domain-containing protein, partial [Chitinophagaceae bacterium]
MQITKKLSYLLLLLVVLSECRPPNDGVLVITGTIKNAKDSAKIYLQELPFGSNNPVVADSTRLLPDGSFELKTLAPTEGLYELVIENGPSFLLINDSRNMELKANLNQYKQYVVDGSEASNQLHDFLNKYQKLYSELSSIAQNSDTAVTKLSDSLQASNEEKYQTQLDSINHLIEYQVHNASTATLAYYVLAKSFATMQIDETAELLNVSLKKFPRFGGLQFLATVINKATPKYALLNKKAPKFVVTDTAGKTLSVDSINSKYVLLHFWSGTQPDNQQNLTAIKKAFQQIDAVNCLPMGICIDSLPKRWKRNITNWALNWPQGNDFKEWNSTIRFYPGPWVEIE